MIPYRFIQYIEKKETYPKENFQILEIIINISLMQTL